MKTAVVTAIAALSMAGALAPQSASAAGAEVKLSSYAKAGEVDSLAGVHRAMKAIEAKGGGKIIVDGMYNVRNYINLDSINRNADIQFVGQSTSSTGFVGTTNAPIFLQHDRTPRPDDAETKAAKLANRPVNMSKVRYMGQYRYNTVFKNMKLVKPAGTRGKVFEFRTGAQVNAVFSNLNIDTHAAGSDYEVFYFGPNTQAHGNEFANIRAEIRPTNNSGLVKVATYGHGFNNNLFRSITVYKFNNTGAPAFELRPLNGQYTNNSFQSITGQNCAGGFIHLYGQNGGGIYDSSNWDSPSGTVYRDSIRLGRTSTSGVTQGLVLSGLGRVEQSLGQGALMSGRHLVAIGAGSSSITVQGVIPTPKWTNLIY